MLFNSFQFLWLFPILFVLYYITNKNNNGQLYSTRISNYMLLAISYGLYMQWNPVYTLVLLWVTLVTFGGAMLISKSSQKQLLLIWILVILAILPLFLFKYYNFILSIITDLCSLLQVKIGLNGLNWAIPLGISFFSFQAVGYLLDVYMGRVKVERNWWDYMLFVSFFPQLVSGPISKSDELLPQIKQIRVFDAFKATIGLRYFLWGLFLKVVVADRLGIYVDKVYDSYMYQTGLTCAIASCLYSFQIYADFSGYSLMAIGVGRVFGFSLINNFNRPYCAASITEFWRRWHISLTRWLTTHIYVSLGGNRCSKVRQYWNIMITFFVSGIWHGANLTFIVWGAIHGILQILEKAIGLDPKGIFYQTPIMKVLKPFRILLTFVLVTLAWVFFRMPTVEMAIDFIRQMVTNSTLSLFTTSPDTMLLIVSALLCVIAKDWIEELLPNFKLFTSKYLIIRWTAYVVLSIWILLAGVFDSSSFIYANF